jgi:hypothetical protein
VQECKLGYPRLAAFLDSDENFMVFRRFGYLQARLLLQKQDELRLLEEELDSLDARMHAKRPADLITRDLPAATGAPRKELMEKIENTFCEYGKEPSYLLLHILCAD